MFHRKRVSLGLKPFNKLGTRTFPNFGTGATPARTFLWPAFVLLGSCSLATLTIWSTDPLWDRLYECGVFVVAAWYIRDRSAFPPKILGLPVLALGLWGFGQLLLDNTVYRFATLQTALRILALCLTAFCGYAALGFEDTREQVLKFVAWFGVGIAVTGILTYYSSPNHILWTFRSPYPDTWGPFLSRNNFAQFLELSLPAALWIAARRDVWIYGAAAAIIYAAGLASASRAGAFLMTLQLTAALWLQFRSRRQWLWICAAVGVLSVAAGTNQLVIRLSTASWLGERLDLWKSTFEMISTRPWAGYGLGTFASVYPEFARFDSGYIIEHAHNEWLEWIAEGGIGFGLAWLALARVSLRGLGQCWTWGVLSVMVHALVDFPFFRLGTASWVFVFVGAAARLPYASRGEPK